MADEGEKIYLLKSTLKKMFCKTTSILQHWYGSIESTYVSVFMCTQYTDAHVHAHTHIHLNKQTSYFHIFSTVRSWHLLEMVIQQLKHYVLCVVIINTVDTVLHSLILYMSPEQNCT